MKVNLRFQTFPNIELQKKGVSAKTIRLYAEIELKTKAEWTESYTAIVDTGAPFSLIPLEHLIIGFQDLLSQFQVGFSYREKAAFIEEINS